jgi:hypothetical protein
LGRRNSERGDGGEKKLFHGIYLSFCACPLSERHMAKRLGVLASFSHSAAFFSLTHGRWRDIDITTVMPQGC